MNLLLLRILTIVCILGSCLTRVQATNATVKYTLYGHTDLIESLVVLPNGDLASSSWDNTIKIWSTVDGTLKQTLSPVGTYNWPTNKFASLIALPNGDLLSSSAYEVCVWNVTEGTFKRNFITLRDSNILTVALFPNGDLATGLNDSLSSIVVWNQDGTTNKRLVGHSSVVVSLLVLPNGDLVSGSNDTTIKIWSMSDGTVKRTLVGHTGRVSTLVLLPNGDLASGSWDKTIKIWSLIDGRLKRTIVAFEFSQIYSLALLPLSGDLITGSAESTMKIFNPNDGTLKLNISLSQFYSSTTALTVLKSGELVSANMDYGFYNKIRIWNRGI